MTTTACFRTLIVTELRTRLRDNKNNYVPYLLAVCHSSVYEEGRIRC